MLQTSKLFAVFHSHITCGAMALWPRVFMSKISSLNIILHPHVSDMPEARSTSYMYVPLW